MLKELDEVAPLVTDPPHANSTTGQNPPICNPPFTMLYSPEGHKEHQNLTFTEKGLKSISSYLQNYNVKTTFPLYYRAPGKFQLHTYCRWWPLEPFFVYPQETKYLSARHKIIVCKRQNSCPQETK